MKILLSPAKSINFDIVIDNYIDHTLPFFLEEADKINNFLKNKEIEELIDIMGISYNLAMLNYYRFKNYNREHTLYNSKQALYVFIGDVYRSLDVKSLIKEDIDYLQNKLFILSGFYGILRPLDIIQPYRLEMGTNISIEKKRNLYDFWGNKITNYINREEDDFIVNLASEEYFKVINKSIKPEIINIYFKEYREGKYKSIGILAKKARGEMLNFLTKEKIDDREDIKLFSRNNYVLDNENSDRNNYVFIRN